MPFILPRRATSRVLSTRPGKLLAYWPLGEASGVPRDLSGHNYVAAHTAVTQGVVGAAGRKAASYDGSTSLTNVYGVPFLTALNGNRGSFSCLVKVSSADVWTDSTRRTIFQLRPNSTNIISIYKSTDATGVLYLWYYAGSTSNTVGQAINSATTDTLHVGMTWENGVGATLYINGMPVKTTTANGTWDGTVNQAGLSCVGAQTTVPAAVWSGTIQDAGVWTDVLTDAEMRGLAQDTPRYGFVVVSFDDGNISDYSVAFAKMQQYGIPGTSYVNSSTFTQGGYLSLVQAQEMYAARWDFGNHTDSHTDLTTLNQSQQEAEFTTCQAFLDGLGFTRGSKHVAFPTGANDANTALALAATGMLTGRGGGGASVHPATVDPHLIESQSDTTLANLKAQTQLAIASHDCYFWHGHDLGEATTPTQADFEAWIDWLAQNQVPCLTVSEFYQRMLAAQA